MLFCDELFRLALQKWSTLGAFCSSSLRVSHKYAWSFEVNEERYEHARSVSRSPQADCGDSPTRSLHWSKSSNAELESVQDEPLRFYCHATLRFKYEKNLRKVETLRFMDAFALPATSTNVSKRRFGDFVTMKARASYTCR